MTTLQELETQLADLDAQIAGKLASVGTLREEARDLQRQRDLMVNQVAVAKKISDMSPQEREELRRQLTGE